MLYYTWHIGDWRKSTARLSVLERALYRELLDELYDSERPLPESVEKLSDLLGLEKASEISALRTVLRKKFVEFEGGWIQARAWSEILAYNEFRDKRRASGKEGGRSKHRRLLEQKLASASKCQPGAKQNLAPLDTISHLPDPSNHSPDPSEPGVPGELAAGDTRTSSDSGGGNSDEEPQISQRAGMDEEKGSGIEFPPGWPDSAEKAVRHVQSLMLPVPAHGLPHEDWVKEVWLQAVGREFRDGASVQIRQFAHWVQGRWNKEGASWLGKRAEAARKKEGGAVLPEVYGTAPEIGGGGGMGMVPAPEGWQDKGEELFEHRWERWEDVPEVNRREIWRALVGSVRA